MFLRYLFVLSAGIIVTDILPAPKSLADDCVFGCCSRPACGKVCQLVCDTKKLTAMGYGYECKDICIPCPSQAGCKHCAACCGECECCAGCGPCCDACQPHAPICKFCWRDWFACGCAQPRTVKVLTKYQAEKKIDWYHWEVVDAGCCDGASCCAAAGSAATHSVDGRLCIYKPAPPGANIGDEFVVSDDDRPQLARWMETQQSDGAVQPASASEPAGPPAWRTFSRWIRLGN